MSGRGLLLVAAVAGAGFWAYRQGYLDDVIERFSGADSGFSLDVLDGLFETGGGPSPVVAANASGTSYQALSIEEQFLWDHMDEMSPWAMDNGTWVAAMMWQESRGNPKAKSNKNAIGLLQVLTPTAEWMFNLGWDKYQPTTANLYKPKINIYFGTAFLEYLSRQNSDRAWITRAYNAGPEGKRSDGTWPDETVKYLDLVTRRYDQLAGGDISRTLPQTATASAKPEPAPQPERTAGEFYYASLNHVGR